MSGRMPFTLNSMLLLPLLRSLPVASAISVVATFLSILGLDFGLLGLGRPETAADQLVALMMSFSVAAPASWAVYLCLNTWAWAVSVVKWYRTRNQTPSA